MGKICDFSPISCCISVTVQDRAWLLLITNRKSYTGSRLAPNSMTLNAKIGGFMDFLTILGCHTSLYCSQGGATELSLCDSAVQHKSLNF